MTQFLKSTTISGFDNDNTSWSSHKNIREHPPVDGGAVVRQFSDSWAAAPSGRMCDDRYLSRTRYERNLQRGTVFWNCVCSWFENSLTVTEVLPVFLRNPNTFPSGSNWFYCNILIFYYCVHVDGSVNLWIAFWTWWVSFILSRVHCFEESNYFIGIHQNILTNKHDY